MYQKIMSTGGLWGVKDQNSGKGHEFKTEGQTDKGQTSDKWD